MSQIPKGLTIIFFPPNMTSNHQPADMGMLASLKVGYKVFMLGRILLIFDSKCGYKKESEILIRQRRDCKELAFGGKANILDAMDILILIWEKYGKYATEEGVQHCWRKANILPTDWDIYTNNEVGWTYLLNKYRTMSKKKR